MPWGETIADYVGKRQDRRSKSRNDMWAKLMDAATMGKGVWDTINEQNKYKPGSDYYKYQEMVSKTWPQENAAYNTALDERIVTFKNANPGKTAEQLTAEWLQTPDGIAYLAEGRKREDIVAKMEHDYKMSEIAASRNPKEGELQTRLNEALSSVTTLNPDFTIPDPNNPNNSILDLNKAMDIKDAVLAYFTDPAEKAWAAKMFDQTIARWKQKPDQKPQADQKPIFAPPEEKKPTKPKFADITSLAQKLWEARKVAGNDPNAKRILDYIQGQMPRASFPGGGPDYSKNSIEWTAQAIETVNRILGIVTPQNTTPGMKGLGNPLLK